MDFNIERIISERDDTLELASKKAIEFLKNVPNRRITPSPEAISRLSEMHTPMPLGSSNTKEVIKELDEIGSQSAMLTNSPRFFGFVTGGNLPVTVAAQWLAAAWDQIPNMNVLSPFGCAVEEVAERWLVDLLGFESETRCSFVTGTTTADIVCLLAARNTLLENAGWDYDSFGLFGSPKIRVIVGEEVHTTLLRALRVIGFGDQQIEFVPVDKNGAIEITEFPEISNEPTIICLQAGNVDSGSFDPFDQIIKRITGKNTWVHIDGAFGLWAAASPKLKHLVKGFEKADSWAMDAHKWLNVPYDSGLAFYRNEIAVRKSLRLKGNYLIQESSDPMNTTLEASRRARGIEVWAALRSLGKNGVANLIENSCELARYFEKLLREEGYEILNDPTINQVMVSFGSDKKTRAVIESIQNDGTIWMSGTNWNGREAMRISVSCWSTSEADINLSMKIIREIIERLKQEQS